MMITLLCKKVKLSGKLSVKKVAGNVCICLLFILEECWIHWYLYYLSYVIPIERLSGLLKSAGIKKKMPWCKRDMSKPNYLSLGELVLRLPFGEWENLFLAVLKACPVKLYLGTYCVDFMLLSTDNVKIPNEVFLFFHQFFIMTSRQYNTLKFANYWNSNFWFR